jgi:apolipoprotein D and lipocalin family protein
LRPFAAANCGFAVIGFVTLGGYLSAMLKRLPVFLAALAACLAAAPVSATPQPMQKIELGSIMGRWYEVARVPNALQRNCQADSSDWTRTTDGFAVVQSCHKGAPNGPLAEWKAKARVSDPATNAKFRMSFFGGLVTQEYWVLDHRADQGWLILSTQDGRYMWLMSQHPTLPPAARAEAIARIRQLGFDPARLEYPLPAQG